MDRISRIPHALALLAAITPVGFLFKGYRGPLHTWFNDYGAGLLYEVFWILAVFAILPASRFRRRIPVAVFVATCVIEALQLWHPPFLEAFRASFIGSALIGTRFSWWDFPHYAVGCLVGWLLLERLCRLPEGR